MTPDPDRQDPRDRDSDQRSDAPVLSPLLIVVLILIAGALVYVASGLFG